MANHEWESFREEIERLYVLENKTLPEVMDYMSSKYTFERSSGCLNFQLTKANGNAASNNTEDNLENGNFESFPRQQIGNGLKREFKRGSASIRKKARYTLVDCRLGPTKSQSPSTEKATSQARS